MWPVVPTCVITQFDLFEGWVVLAVSRDKCFGWWCPDGAGARGKRHGGDELSLPRLSACTPGDTSLQSPALCTSGYCFPVLAQLLLPLPAASIGGEKWGSGALSQPPTPRTSTGSGAHEVCSMSLPWSLRTLLHRSNTLTAAGVGSPTTSTCCCGLIGVQPRAPTVLIQRWTKHASGQLWMYCRPPMQPKPGLLPQGLRLYPPSG